jgi:hypothetical protein
MKLKREFVLYDPHLSISPVVDEYNISPADIKRILALPCVGIEVNLAKV